MSPLVALRLLRDVGGISLPEDTPLQVIDGELNDRLSVNRMADTVLMLGPKQDPTHFVISEIETEVKAEKLQQVLRYAATLWLQLNKPVYVLIITPDTKATKFTGEVSHTAGAFTATLDPCICGPDQIPIITDSTQVAADPPAGALSLMAHGSRSDVREAFCQGIKAMRDDDGPRYYEYGYNMAATPIRRALEAMMSTTDWPVHSPFARKHFGEGKAEGLAEGEAKGLAKGEAKTLFAVLEARQIAITDEIRDRITTCTDEAQLMDWVARASKATTADEVF